MEKTASAALHLQFFLQLVLTFELSVQIGTCVEWVCLIWLNAEIAEQSVSLPMCSKYLLTQLPTTGDSLQGRPKNRGLCFKAYNFRKYWIGRYKIWHKSKSLHSEHRVRIYLNKLWKIVGPSSEWQWHFNYRFWIGDHFLTSLQPTCLHYFTFLLINDVRMTTFAHQLLSRKTSTPEVWQCECEYSSRSATCPLCCAWTMQKSFSFNQTES